MKLGYNTNGFAHHRIEDALTIIAEIGYESVALTLDHDTLDPPDRSAVGRCVQRLRPIIERTGLSVTIETGARFILDPRRKHWPTLISTNSDDRERRIEYLRAAIDVAAELGAQCVSLWSGTADPNRDRKGAASATFHQLYESLQMVIDHSERRNMRLGFEPEPGMFIDTMARFTQLVNRLDHPLLGLTLDVGHLHCLSDGHIREHLVQHGKRLFNVHIEDMRRNVHEHLMFGEGEIDFPHVLTALQEANYTGPLHVELSRHSSNAVETARAAYQFLQGRQ